MSLDRRIELRTSNPYQSIRKILWVCFVPIAFLWAFVTWARRKFYFRKPYSPQTPVLCVGNLHSGGSGKTPTVMAVAEKYKNANPTILTRGYRAKVLKGIVDLSKSEGVSLFGDEPWQMAKVTGVPVCIDRNRVRAIKELEGKAGLIIMDDGFQRLELNATLNVVSINARRDPSQAFCLPLGDLREPFSALKSAHAVLLFGRDDEDWEKWETVLQSSFAELPIFRARQKPQAFFTKRGLITTPREVGAFCGIASPERFLDDVVSFTDLKWHRIFSDHHIYSQKDLDLLWNQTKESGCRNLVTTEKDWHKVSEVLERLGCEISYLKMTCEFEDNFWYFLESGLRLSQ